MKTIKVSEKNWKKLMKARMDLGCKNLDEIIDRILNMVSAYKLWQELKDIKK